MRTIAVLNQKGGVGKTTTVANTAAALATMGSRVLAIDLDPQEHLTIHLGLEPQGIEAGAYKVLTRSAEVADEIVLSRRNLWLLPANINLVGAETELVSVVGREIILREALEKVEDRFDYCFIDCPPSLGLLTLNSLAAAQEVLIPLQPHFLALQGVGKLLQTIELVNKRINPELRVEGILLCMFDTRASLPNEVRADIKEFLSNARGTNCAWAKARILPTFIRRNIKLAEAPSYGKTIFEYEQNCHGAEDYKAVAEFIHSGSRSHGQGQTHEPVPVAITPVQVPAKSPEPPQPIRQASNPAENPVPTPPRPIAQPLSEPRPSPERRLPVETSPVAQYNPQPKPRLTSTYEYHPQPPAPARPNPQPVIGDAASRQAPIEIRQIPRNGSLTPQQQAARQNNGQPRAARIIEITPLNQPKPSPEPDRARPAEPTQGR
jgi:chromosome partitioning protein